MRDVCNMVKSPKVWAAPPPIAPLRRCSLATILWFWWHLMVEALWTTQASSIMNHESWIINHQCHRRSRRSRRRRRRRRSAPAPAPAPSPSSSWSCRWTYFPWFPTHIMIRTAATLLVQDSRWVRFRHLSSRTFRNRSEKSDYSFKSSNENKPLAICGFEPWNHANIFDIQFFCGEVWVFECSPTFWSCWWPDGMLCWWLPGWCRIFHFRPAWISTTSEAPRPTFRVWWKLWKRTKTALRP